MRITARVRESVGATLAEVTLAVAIIGLMASAIIAAYNYGFFVMGLARENQRATQVMLEKAETIRLYRWDRLDTIPVEFTDTFDPHAASGNQGVVYHGVCSISNFPFATSYSSNLRQVNITVTWTNQTQRIQRSRSLQTLIAADGVQNYVY